MIRLQSPIDMMDKETKDTNEKKQRRHDANANDTKPHPAASYVPEKCHRMPEPADEGQETKYKYGAATHSDSGAVPTPNTQTNNPDYVACSIKDPPRPKRIPRPSPELVTIDSLGG